MLTKCFLLQIEMGGTDCALPMLHAIEMKYSVDVFIVYTDNETWFGSVHPSEALKRYRKVGTLVITEMGHWVCLHV